MTRTSRSSSRGRVGAPGWTEEGPAVETHDAAASTAEECTAVGERTAGQDNPAEETSAVAEGCIGVEEADNVGEGTADTAVVTGTAGIVFVAVVVAAAAGTRTDWGRRQSAAPCCRTRGRPRRSRRNVVSRAVCAGSSRGSGAGDGPPSRHLGARFCLFCVQVGKRCSASSVARTICDGNQRPS